MATRASTDAAGKPVLTVREATLTDLPAVSELARRFDDEEGFVTSGHGISDNLRVLIDATTAHVCLAESDGRAVGFAVTTTVVGLEASLVAELQDLYVHPSARRSGAGGVLVENARAWATEAGCDVLDVVIDSDGDKRHNLSSFYAQRGFRDSGRRLLSRQLTKDPSARACAQA